MTPDPNEEGGRGLFLVARLSTRWDWYLTPGAHRQSRLVRAVRRGLLVRIVAVLTYSTDPSWACAALVVVRLGRAGS